MGQLACDPRRLTTPFDHRVVVESLQKSARPLGLDVASLQEREVRFAPLITLSPSLQSRFEEVLAPLPIPRLVDELFARYAADLQALAATLKRYADGG